MARRKPTPPPEAVETPQAPVAAAPAQDNPPPAPAPTKHEHSRRSILEAKRAGFSQEEIDSTPPDVLEDRLYEKHLELLARLESYAQQQDQIRQHAPSPPPSPPPEPEEEISFAEGEMDPRFQKLAERLKAKSQKLNDLEAQNKAILEKQTASEKREQEREIREKVGALDRFFNSLPADYGFGKGSIRTIGKEAGLKRKAVVDALATYGTSEENFWDTYESSGNEAVKALFGALTPAPTLANAYKPNDGKPRAADGKFTKEQWDAAGAAVPTERLDDEPPSTAKAVKNAEAKLAEMRAKGTI